MQTDKFRIQRALLVSKSRVDCRKKIVPIHDAICCNFFRTVVNVMRSFKKKSDASESVDYSKLLPTGPPPQPLLECHAHDGACCMHNVHLGLLTNAHTFRISIIASTSNLTVFGHMRYAVVLSFVRYLRCGDRLGEVKRGRIPTRSSSPIQLSDRLFAAPPSVENTVTMHEVQEIRSNLEIPNRGPRCNDCR